MKEHAWIDQNQLNLSNLKTKDIYDLSQNAVWISKMYLVLKMRRFKMQLHSTGYSSVVACMPCLVRVRNLTIPCNSLHCPTMHCPVYSESSDWTEQPCTSLKVLSPPCIYTMLSGSLTLDWTALPCLVVEVEEPDDTLHCVLSVHCALQYTNYSQVLCSMPCAH